MTISELTLEPSDAEPVRRFEVFTGSGRRREWSAAEQARIVAESHVPGARVSEVARRYALSPQQLFTWRRKARRAIAEVAAPAPLFVPAVVATPDSAGKRPVRARRPAADPATGTIELEIAGVAMRIGRGADAETVAAVIRAVKATS